MENPAELILKTKGPRGLSLKQLSLKMGVPIRRVKYHINTSDNIKYTDPILHGSFKQSIRVFCYSELTSRFIRGIT